MATMVNKQQMVRHSMDSTGPPMMMMMMMMIRVSKLSLSPANLKRLQNAENGFLCFTHVQHGLRNGTVQAMKDQVDQVAQDRSNRSDRRRSLNMSPQHPSPLRPKHLEHQRQGLKEGEVQRARHRGEAYSSKQVRTNHSGASTSTPQNVSGPPNMEWGRQQGEGSGTNRKHQRSCFAAPPHCQTHRLLQ